MTAFYDPADWFWVLGDDKSRAWSSAAGTYVTDFPADRLTRIASEDELSDVLRPYGVKLPKPTVDDVAAERERRLQLGFDYRFADVRGAHHIGTTDADMKGWDEVTKATQAAIALGQSTALFDIVTNTGQVTITALEWQQILVAASAARQPLWAASFTLEASNPIPADFKDDKYWIAA